MYELALALSVVCLIGVGLYYASSPLFSIYHPFTFYWLFHGFLFVFRPIVGWVLDFRRIYEIYQFNPSMDDRITVILASNLGFLAFAFFSLRAGNVPMAFRNVAYRAEERRQLAKVLPLVLLVCVPLGLYSLMQRLDAATVGQAVRGMRLDMATGTSVNTSAIGYLTDAQLMLASICALIAWIYRFKLPALLPLAGFVLLRAGTGGRGPFVIALAMTGMLYLYENRLKFPAWRAVLAAAAVLALFSTVGDDRGLGIRQSLGFEQQVRETYQARETKFLEGMDFGNLEFFEYVVYVVPQRSGAYDYFLNNLQLLTEPIPRVFWPEKPIGAPIKMVELFRYGFPIGMTFSLPGLGWYQFGWLGVVIWCGLWGGVLGYVYKRFALGSQSAILVATFTITLSILIVAYRDGSPITFFRTFVFYIFPVILLALLQRANAIPTARELCERAGRKVRFGVPGQALTSSAPDSAASLSGSAPVAETPRERRRRLAGSLLAERG